MFINKGAEIDEMLAYLSHNIQHDIMKKSNKDLAQYLKGEQISNPIVIEAANQNFMKYQKANSKRSSNFDLTHREFYISGNSMNNTIEKIINASESPMLKTVDTNTKIAQISDDEGMEIN